MLILLRKRQAKSGDLLFEVMAYNQHYIHATRLIDFTKCHRKCHRNFGRKNEAVNARVF